MIANLAKWACLLSIMVATSLTSASADQGAATLSNRLAAHRSVNYTPKPKVADFRCGSGICRMDYGSCCSGGQTWCCHNGCGSEVGSCHY